jgi:hypothetical protein
MAVDTAGTPQNASLLGGATWFSALAPAPPPTPTATPIPAVTPIAGLCSPANGILPGETCFPNLPAPVLVFEGTENYSASGGLFTRYLLTVSNRASFPDQLFSVASDLPACGLNTSSSRTWMDIFAAGGSYVYGFCGLRSSADLNDIWFAVPMGQAPPAAVYIRMTDRRFNVTYTSNTVAIASPSP